MGTSEFLLELLSVETVMEYTQKVFSIFNV